MSSSQLFSENKLSQRSLRTAKTQIRAADLAPDRSPDYPLLPLIDNSLHP
ncbi:MAG: hypothetical protein F6K53_43490 [Moorea sp. SIO4A1]|nr:hypothetical protein [Moorena sp. SIO4A1]